MILMKIYDKIFSTGNAKRKNVYVMVCLDLHMIRVEVFVKSSHCNVYKNSFKKDSCIF